MLAAATGVIALGLVPSLLPAAANGATAPAPTTAPSTTLPGTPDPEAARLEPGETAPITVGAVRHDGVGSPEVERYGADTKAEAQALIRELDAQPDVSNAAVSTARYHALGDPGRAQQWGYNALNFAAARAARSGASAGQVVAVIDSGVRGDHTDLAGVLLPGADCWSFSTCVNTGGYNGTNDDFGHGTEVAGVIAAVADNERGVTGAAAGVRILPVKVLDELGSGYEIDVANGIYWALDHGATVINLSLGGPPSPQTFLLDAVNYAVNTRGVPVVAAAGNDGPFNSGPVYPAGWANVISVGSVDPNLTVSNFSDRGVGGTPTNQWLDLVAPGSSILTTSTVCPNCYSWEDGTSFAAPFASAAVALVRSAAPGLAPPAIEALLESTARDLGPAGYDTSYGNGLLQPYRAVTQAATVYTEDLDGSGVGGGFGRTANALGPGTRTSALLYAGSPHVFSYDATAGRLRHEFWDGSRWRFEDLDGPGVGGGSGRVGTDVGRNPVAFTVGFQLDVVYSGANGALRHGWWTGSKWMFETLDGPGGIAAGATGTALSGSALTPSYASYLGAPHVFYERANGTRLGHAWWTGTQWKSEALDGAGSPPGLGATPNAVGANSSAQFINGQLDVFYDDTTGNNIRHAWYRNGWRFETIDGEGGGPGARTPNVVRDASLMAYNGAPHIYYYDATANRLRHAFWTGTTWQYELLDNAGGWDTGNEPVAALVDGMPYVYAFDATNNTLRRGYYTGFTWVFAPIDGASSASVNRTTNAVGRGASVVLFGGRPHLFYLDATQNRLRHAWTN